jgi:hypothetical protein
MTGSWRPKSGPSDPANLSGGGNKISVMSVSAARQ